MSVVQNLSYSGVQVAHNFGAVAVVGCSIAALLLRAEAVRKRLAWGAIAGWSIQGASGAAFGAVSYHFYHAFPDISGVAVIALILKMACAATGFLLLAAYLFRGGRWTDRQRDVAWRASTLLSATALTAAAFLRWFS